MISIYLLPTITKSECGFFNTSDRTDVLICEKCGSLKTKEQWNSHFEKMVQNCSVLLKIPYDTCMIFIMNIFMMGDDKLGEFD